MLGSSKWNWRRMQTSLRVNFGWAEALEKTRPMNFQKSIAIKFPKICQAQILKNSPQVRSAEPLDQ